MLDSLLAIIPLFTLIGLGYVARHADSAEPHTQFVIVSELSLSERVAAATPRVLAINPFEWIHLRP